jgi:hypothetical protein
MEKKMYSRVPSHEVRYVMRATTKVSYGAAVEVDNLVGEPQEECMMSTTTSFPSVRNQDLIDH